MRLVLASASPRRKSLLKQIGLSFSVQPPKTTENTELNGDVLEFAIANARAKATEIRRYVSSDRIFPQLAAPVYVLAADTVVVQDDTALGKPRDDEEAFEMLRRLRGRKHQVVTGVVILVIPGRGAAEGAAVTDVTMTSFSDEEIASYIASGEHRDKAGAYGIQGRAAVLVESISGSYSNVVGLPLELTRKLFLKLGVDNLLND